MEPNEYRNYLSDSSNQGLSSGLNKSDSQRFKSLPGDFPKRAKTEINFDSKLDPKKIKKPSSPSALWDKVKGMAKKIGITKSDPHTKDIKKMTIREEVLNHTKWNTFEEISKNESAYKALKDFAKGRFCEEIFLFFEAYENYKSESKSLNSDEIVSELTKIYNTFIKVESENELNISSDLRKGMKNIFEKNIDEDLKNSKKVFKFDFAEFDQVHDMKTGIESLMYVIETDNLKELVRNFKNSMNK